MENQFCIDFPTENDKQLLNELLGAADAGGLNEETIENFRYEHLRALLRYSVLLGEGNEFYIQVKRYLEAIGIERLKKKREKIRIAFIVSGIPVWCEDELYRMLEESGFFEPYVYVFLHNIGQGEKMMLEEYKQHVAFFKEKGMRVVETVGADGTIYTWDQIGDFPDMCIWTTPWIYTHTEKQNFINYPLSTIHMYIPYCYMISNNGVDYDQKQFNYEFHNMITMVFEESGLAVEMAGKFAYVGKENVVFTGPPKMDKFYETIGTDPWEDVVAKCGNTNIKKIIYAPHHSMIQEEGTFAASTFHYNYRTMLELAKKYAEDTVWLFKPHPALKFKTIQTGLFKDEAEWEAYVDEWKSLKNAIVYEGTDYVGLFMYSDAMILDSMSFIAEYMFADKPALYLTRDDMDFNEYGRCLLEALYMADGKDSSSIEKFIREVVLNATDTKQQEREYLFSKYLAYRGVNGLEQSAASNIFDNICALFV